ncbi:MAG TPA: radical SAM protein, partial [Candidatus Eisenbacteria bacterium]|nr:radical SAM protein [Candidatus Eisenbacteria bacterium]
GHEPFELTKRFVSRSPGAFPGYSLLSAFGQAARLNLEYQSAGRVIPLPFHFLNNNHAMNVRPKNYSWPVFYDHVIDLTKHTFSWPTMIRRHQATGAVIPKWMNLVRGVSSEGFGRIKYHSRLRRHLDTDRELRSFFDQESTVVPQFFVNRLRRELGPLWDWLPEGALDHDPNAYLKEELERTSRRETHAAGRA